ncbi:uncharacterized protein si:ch211-214p13.7 [Chiloscyllium plagiosum]|uniref:uncharacterized protein si:ch211-214p13.7 n=1 Tax=Chiloscyllium plagiosum TaxID=36176 RepID=UPI001CB88774|nr:uncharacterized protein si:ch211-214p13.7 [Chiloscyllium plagiosum]
MGNCCKKTQKKEYDHELDERQETESKKNEEILYVTVEHNNPTQHISNEVNLRDDNTCEYAVINYNCKQDTTISEQDTQEYEEVIPN